tara:strand:- start:22248 stop:23405 length:1158 start_codon:yes stop_codon:yes gene_type:complete
MEMKKCSSCGLPETYETLEINEDIKSCNICQQHQFKNDNINWSDRKIELNQIADEYRGKNEYDCIVPFSGGKDSTFTLYYIVKELKLRPLVIQFNHGFFRSNLIDNNTKTFKELGVNVLSFTPNWDLVKKLMKISLVRKGDFCWHCHTGIFAYPIRVAVNQNIPLVIWGEPSSEYTAYYSYEEKENVDKNRFDRFINLGINAEDMQIILEQEGYKLDARDLLPFSYPNEKELDNIKLRSICLGTYIPWDVKKQVEVIKKELNWHGDEVEGMPWNEYPYEKIECYMQGVRDYIKFLKRGYGRVTQMTALDLRNKRITKEKAEELIFKYENKKPHSLKLFLEYLEISEDEFNEIVSKTVVYPNEPNFSVNQYSEKTWDFDQWYTKGK